MYRMISQLIGGGGWASLEDEEEDELMVTGPKVKRRQCTMAVLSTWYKVSGLPVLFTQCTIKCICLCKL